MVLPLEFGYCEGILLYVDSGLDAVRLQVRNSGSDDGIEDLPVVGDSTGASIAISVARGGGEEGTVEVLLQQFPMGSIWFEWQ